MTDTIHVAEEVVVSGFKPSGKPAEEFVRSLVGKLATEATKLIEAAGFQARTVHEGDRITMDHVEGRINLHLKGDMVDSANVG